MQWRLSPLVGRLTLMILALALALPGNAQAPSKRERQLTQRVDQVYRLFVSGEWRKVEAFLTKDSLDLWAGQAKGTITSFRIEEVKVAPDGKQADATVQVTFNVPKMPMVPFTLPQKSQWLYQKGKWFLKLKRPPPVLELFKTTRPSEVEVAPSPLSFAQNPIQLPVPQPDAETVVKIFVQNMTIGDVTVEDLRTTCSCLTAEMDRTTFHSADRGVLTVKYVGPYPPAQPTMHVQATLSPMMYLLDLPVVFSKE